MNMMIDKIKVVIQAFFSLEGSLFRYSLSFCFLLALLPGIIVSLLLFQYSILGVNDLLVFLYQFVPEDLIAPFVDFIMDKEYQSIISVVASLALPCFVASKSFYSFMLISAKNENFKTHKILIRLKSYFLFFIFISSIVGIAVLVNLLNINAIYTFGIGLFIIFYFFYRMLSFEKRPISFGVIGSIFSSLAIVIVGYLFFNMVNHYTSYQTMYGPLASLVMLFLAVYIISCIIYFGYCLNIVFGSFKEIREYKSEWYYNIGNKWIKKFKQKFMKEDYR